jgi:hypothetical protein
LFDFLDNPEENDNSKEEDIFGEQDDSLEESTETTESV